MLPFAITARSTTILRGTTGTVDATVVGITGLPTDLSGREGQATGPEEAAGPAAVEAGAAEAVAGAAVAAAVVAEALSKQKGSC